MKKHYTIPIFIPELACPFQCVFCNQRKITGKKLIPDDREIKKTVEDHIASFKIKNRIVEIGFFGGSFTGIPMDQQEHYLKLIQPYLESNQVSGIRLSTRPDYISVEVLELLKKYNVTTIELGAQSMDDEVLKASFRGHTVQQTEEASQLILEYGFELGLQMMIGLPGDTFEKSLRTAHRIIELGASNTRIYPTVVIKDTALNKWFDEGKFIPLSLEESIHWTKQILPVFEQAKLKVLRVGLHPSEGLLNGEDLIAGPFHQSFKELVLTEIWSDLLKPLTELKAKKNIEIIVPEKEINYAIGYQAKNKKMLMEHFDEVKYIDSPDFIDRNKFLYH